MGVVIQKRQLHRPPHQKQLSKSPQQGQLSRPSHQKQLSRPPDQRQFSRPPRKRQLCRTPQQKHSTPTTWSLCVMRPPTWSLCVTRPPTWSLCVTTPPTWSLCVTRPPTWPLCVVTPPLWFMKVEVPELGQMHESSTDLWDTGQKASQDKIGLYGVHQQREEHGHLGQLGAGHAHHQQVRQVVLPSGRPPEEVSGREKAPGYDEVFSCDDSSGNGCKDENNDITQKSSFRNKYEQKLSVLEGGGTSLVVKCRLHEKQNKSSAAFHLGSPRGEKSEQAQALWLAGRHI